VWKRSLIFSATKNVGVVNPHVMFNQRQSTPFRTLTIKPNKQLNFGLAQRYHNWNKKNEILASLGSPVGWSNAMLHFSIRCVSRFTRADDEPTIMQTLPSAHRGEEMLTHLISHSSFRFCVSHLFLSDSPDAWIKHRKNFQGKPCDKFPDISLA
jgi:hypothetical protein